MLQKGCIFLLFSLFFVACFTKKEEIVVAHYPDNSPKLVKYYLVHSDKIRELIKETAYYPQHKKLMEGTYQDSLRNGLWQSWYENGALWSQSEYARGFKHGKCITFYENGKIRYEGSYEQDKKVGEWFFFDSTGKQTNSFKYN